MTDSVISGSNNGFFNGWLGGSAAPPPESGTTSENKVVKKPVNYPTEFHRVYNEWLTDVEPRVRKYPVIAVISILVLALLGISNVLSFSPTRIMAGVFCLACTAALVRAIIKDPTGFLNDLKKSIYEIKDALFKMNKNKASETTTTEENNTSPETQTKEFIVL